jgi:hypothetical protein
MLLLVEAGQDCVRGVHAGLPARLLARVTAGRLTDRLARGADPDSSVLLGLRARELLGETHRRALAGALLELLERSLGPPPPRSRSRVPADWVAVRRARWELGELAALLDSRGPVAVRGVALVEQLLGDGAGPLYYRDDPDGLARAARAATIELDLGRSFADR